MEINLFVKKVATFIARYNLLRFNDKVVVALSGGADSVALLISLHTIGYNCMAAHCNFHLRGNDSNNDELFARKLCEKLNIPIEVIEFDVQRYQDVHKVSIEMACRELRYDWFDKILKKHCAQKLAVGHHKDDNTETFFLNILRGSGINGLAAIKPINGYIIRPLLGVHRNEIESFLASINQNFVTDCTNLQNDYKRNKIRNIIVPHINTLFPCNGIERTINDISSCNEFYQGAIAEAINKCKTDNEYQIDKILNHKGYKTLIFEIINKFGFNSQQAEDISFVIKEDNHSGKQFFSSTHKIVIKTDSFIIIENSETELTNYYKFYLSNIPTDIPLNISIKSISSSETISFVRNPYIAYFDANIASKELTLRKWKLGDKFTPFGMKGKKKISDLFVDNKISSDKKNSYWILECDNEIIWVIGLKNSNLYRCSPGKDTVCITVEP